MPPTLHDRISLWALRLAKRGKLRLKAGERDFDESFFDIDRAVEYYEDVRRVLRYLEVRRGLDQLGVQPQRVLDVGCGVGDCLASLPPAHLKVGMDLAYNDLVVARRLTLERGELVQLVQASASRLPFRESTFDLVTCFEVLEHLADERDAIRELRRVLKKGYGVLAVSVPSTWYFSEYRELMGHYRHYFPQGVVRLLGEEGFRVVKFLDPHDGFNLFYFYVHASMWLVNFCLNRMTGERQSFYRRKIPFCRSTWYSAVVRPAMLRLARFWAREGPSEPSTFLLAQAI